MCGGYTIIASGKKLMERFKTELPSQKLIPNYNARPGNFLPVIKSHADKEKNNINLMHWGYLPHWAGKSSFKQVINARLDSLAAKPFFMESFTRRRCLVIADSFYEWKALPDGKQPYRFLMKDHQPFAMAGIWDEFMDKNGKKITGYAIITLQANTIMKPIHDRMPAILDYKDENSWLEENIKPQKLLSILQPYNSDLMTSYRVSKAINIPSNNAGKFVKTLEQELL